MDELLYARITTVNDVTGRKTVNLIKDKSLADLDNLPSLDVLADEIIENLQSALESFLELKEQLR